jgi:hypothetical protein
MGNLDPAIRATGRLFLRRLSSLNGKISQIPHNFGNFIMNWSREQKGEQVQ